jgi:hypothetical protein
MDMYKLVDKVPVPCTLEEYSESFRKNRIVGKTSLPDGRHVSTVFLCLDHNWGDGPPILFESMLFGAEGYSEEQDMDRYETWDEAYEGHRRMVEKHGGTMSPKDFFDDELFEL